MTGRIARDPAKVTTIPATPPGEDPGPAPASPPQRRLWFLDRLEPGSTAYHVPMALHLLGDLDVEALGHCDRGAHDALLAVVFHHVRDKVAIKVVHPEIAATLGTERFLREIRIAAQLEHPHILSLHDSGEADGLPYYVMPYVEGESLQERLQEGPLETDEAVKVALQVANGLEYAHRKGVVHRDIKPANILLLETHALIADFGVARAVGGKCVVCDVCAAVVHIDGAYHIKADCGGDCSCGGDVATVGEGDVYPGDVPPVYRVIVDCIVGYHFAVEQVAPVVDPVGSERERVARRDG